MLRFVTNHVLPFVIEQD